MALTQYTASAGVLLCNDGTDYKYYYRAPSGGDKTIIVYFAGNGICNGFTASEVFDCNDRTASQTGSAGWPASLPDSTFAYGLLSTNANLNDYSTAGVFYYPQLSSDAWLGTAQDVGSGWYFHGRNILLDLPNQLTARGLDATYDFIIAGESAGGIGLYHAIGNLESATCFGTAGPFAGATRHYIISAATLNFATPFPAAIQTPAQIITTAITLFTGASYFGLTASDDWQTKALQPTQVAQDITLYIQAIPDTLAITWHNIPDNTTPWDDAYDYLVDAGKQTQQAFLEGMNPPNHFMYEGVFLTEALNLSAYHTTLLLPSWNSQCVRGTNAREALYDMKESAGEPRTSRLWSKQIERTSRGGNNLPENLSPNLKLAARRTSAFEATIPVNMPTSVAAVRLTLKSSTADADANAILQVLRLVPTEGYGEGQQILNAAPSVNTTAAHLELVSYINSQDDLYDQEGTTSYVRVYISPATTQAIAAGTYFLDIKAEDGLGSSRILASGTIVFTTPVTLT